MGEDSTPPRSNPDSSDATGSAVQTSESQNQPNPFFEKAKQTLQTALTMDRQVLKNKVKDAVDATNGVLGTLEQKYNCTASWFNAHVQPIVTQGHEMGQKTLVMYEQRRLYGPQWIGASVATTALVAGIKTRGRVVPSLVLSGFVGGLVYAGIYGVPPFLDDATPYRILRKRDD